MLQALVLDGGGLEVLALGFLDDRVDDVDLAAACHLLAALLPHRFLVAVTRQHGLDGDAADGHFVDQRQVEIAVQRQGQRTRDGRGAHHQHVGGAGLGGRGLAALLHAEAVLLVHDRQGEARQPHIALQHRVRAHQQVALARGGGGQHGAPLGGRRRTGQSLDIDAQRRAQPPHHDAVLQRQHLGRRHHHRLVALLDHEQRGDQRDERLARTHVALQQAVHGAAAAQVDQDLGQHAALGAGQRERQRLDQAAREISRLLQRESGLAMDVLATQRHQQLDREQFLVDQAAARGGQRGLVGRKVDVAQGALARGQRAPLDHVSRQDLRRLAGQPLQRLVHEGAQPVLSHPGRQAVHRHQAAGVQPGGRAGLGRIRRIIQQFEIGVRHLQPALVALDEAAGHHLATGLELVLEELLVEPDGEQDTRVIADRDRQQAAPGAGAAVAGGQDLAQDGGFGSRPGPGDGNGGRTVEIAARIVSQEIPHGRDSQPVQGARPGRPHRLEELDMGFQIEDGRHGPPGAGPTGDRSTNSLQRLTRHAKLRDL